MAKTDPNRKRSIWFPGETLWEQWIVTPGREPELAGRAPAADRAFTLNSRGERVLGLPISSVVALPLLSNAPDAAGLEATAKIQAERSGITSDLEGIGYEVLTGMPPATLLRVDAPVPSSSAWDGMVHPEHVCVSAGLLPWAGDCVALWYELGALVVAFSKSGRLVFYDRLSVSTIGQECGAEIQRLLFQLNCQGIELCPEVLNLWTGEGDVAALQAASGITVRQGARPAPVGQGQSRLMPRWLRQHRASLEKRTVIRKRLSAVAAVVMTVVGALTAMGVMESLKHKKLMNRISELTPVASRVENMKAKWDEVASAVDRDATPLEILKALQSTPGATGVNLSHVEIDGEKVVIRGESLSAKSALQFLDEITVAESVAEYGWTFDQPEIRSNGSAAFEIEGVK